jgi:hypothetical protein
VEISKRTRKIPDNIFYVLWIVAALFFDAAKAVQIFVFSRSAYLEIDETYRIICKDEFRP